MLLGKIVLDMGKERTLSPPVTKKHNIQNYILTSQYYPLKQIQRLCVHF